MKPFFLLLSFLIALTGGSQSYRTVMTNSEVYFDFEDVYVYDEPHISRVILTDSFQVLNNDTIIYQQFNQEFELETLWQSFWYCASSKDTGFLGYKTILRDDGTDIYFNLFYDSIFIQTQANLSDTWIFYQNPDNSYFEATVSNVTNWSFLGITDSVKTITIQAKDSSGNNISSPYNTLSIKISKQYGLIEGFNFFRFPYGTTDQKYGQITYKTYEKIRVLGLAHHNIGVTNLTAADVYDYDIGDEYHWLSYSSSFNSIAYTDGYDIITINNKYFSTNGDSVYYDIHLGSYQYSFDFLNNIPTYTFDTLFLGNKTISYDISNNHRINTFTLHNSWAQSADGNRKVLNLGGGWLTDSCLIPPIEARHIYDSTYHKGIGLTSSYTFAGSYSFGRTFLYYNKNGVQWGTPVNINLLSNVSNEDIASNTLPLKVFPNPTNNILNFQFEEPINPAEIRVYSSIGQLIGQKEQTYPLENIVFDVSNWNRGVYFYGVYIKGKLVKQGQVLVND